MFVSKKHLTRRAMLRGLGGALSLPLRRRNGRLRRAISPLIAGSFLTQRAGANQHLVPSLSQPQKCRSRLIRN